MRRGLEILGWLTALLIFAYASHAVLAQAREQQPPQQPAVNVRPAYSTEDARLGDG